VQGQHGLVQARKGHLGLGLDTGRNEMPTAGRDRHSPCRPEQRGLAHAGLSEYDQRPTVRPDAVEKPPDQLQFRPTPNEGVIVPDAR
jgi:hypothetical protein